MTTSAAAGSDTAGRVFVSYSTVDRKFVEVLVAALGRRGVDVMYDESVLRAGDEWQSVLAQAVRDAAVVVVVWSRSSVGSSSVLAEADVGLGNRKLVPVTLDGLDLVPEKFLGIQTVDLSGWSGNPEDPRIERLVEAVRERLPQPPAVSAGPPQQGASFDPTRFSSSMKAARDRLLGVGPVTALQIVDALRALRPNYGDGLLASLTLPVDRGERRLVDDWLAAVARSSRLGVIPGRAVVLELAELDRDVAVAVLPPVLRAIAGELDESGGLTPPLPVEPVLMGGVDSDLVVWDRARPLVDSLQVDTYVTMLATVIADRATPLPLSVGLFGEWGSGKSYFMGLLQQRIAGFAADARSQPDSPFCSAVVQVRFNAWHYADANLWASMAVQLFEQLAGTEEQAEEERERTRASLLTRLRTYEEAKAALAEDERRAQAALAAAETALADTTQRQLTSQAKLDEIRASDVATTVVQDPRLQPMIERVRQEASRVGMTLGPDLGDLHRLAVELGGLGTDAPRLWRLLRERSRLAGLLVVVAAVLVVAGVVLLILPGLLRYGASVLVAAVAAAAAVARPIARVAAGMRTALRHVEQTIAAADSVWQQAEQRRQAELGSLRDDVERARTERLALADRVADSKVRVEQTQREIDDLGAGRRLYRFIAERAASEDYRKQLGVVSLIRQDFEELTRRLRARRDQGTDADLPTVERIVLYIDDLDRCPPDRVVQVLEAVHLLLAMDLFAVVVGVDPRWLLRSLTSHFRQVLSDQQSDGDGYWQSTPRDYLEKIFQIPFALPGMTQQGFTALLHSMVQPTAAPAGHDHATSPGQAEARSTDADQAAIVAEVGSAAEQVATGQTPQRLDLTDHELAFFTGLAPLVRTPRSTKRMINIYRMLRVTRDLGPASRFLGTPDAGGEYQAVAQLLAVLTGHPVLLRRLAWGDHDSDAWPLMRRGPDEPWSAFVTGLQHQTSSLRRSDLDDWHRLVAALNAVQPTVTLTDHVRAYRLWAPRISRFSFALTATRSSGS